MDSKKGTVEIELKRVCLSVVRRIWLILLVGVLIGVMAFGYATIFVKDIYAAEVRMYVNNSYGAGTVGYSSSQMMAAQSLASTYMVFLDNPYLLEEVAQTAETSRTYSVSELRAMIETAAIDETEVFRVVVFCQKPDDAIAIANAINEALPNEVKRATGWKEDAEGDGNGQIAAPLVSLSVQGAEYRGKIAPNEKNYAIIGFLAGILITAIAVIVRDLMDTSINSEMFLTDTYEDIPLLAVIPDAENPKGSSGYKGYYESQKKKPPVQQRGGKAQ